MASPCDRAVRPRLAWWIALAPGLLGGALVSGACDDTCPTGGGRLRTAQEAHACLHARHGPFEPVTADAEGAAAPTVTALHVAYQVHLIAGAEGDHTGTIAFEPRTTATYVFLIDADVPLEVADAADQGLCPSAVAAVSEACPELARADLHPLRQAERYTLTIGPAPVDTVTVLIEKAR
jgi:hypothetical protein